MPVRMCRQLVKHANTYTGMLSAHSCWWQHSLNTYRRLIQRGYGQNVEIVRLRPEDVLQNPRQGVLRLLAAVRRDADMPGCLRLQRYSAQHTGAPCRRPAPGLPMGVVCCPRRNVSSCNLSRVKVKDASGSFDPDAPACLAVTLARGWPCPHLPSHQPQPFNDSRVSVPTVRVEPSSMSLRMTATGTSAAVRIALLTLPSPIIDINALHGAASSWLVVPEQSAWTLSPKSRQWVASESYSSRILQKLAMTMDSSKTVPVSHPATAPMPRLPTTSSSAPFASAYAAMDGPGFRAPPAMATTSTATLPASACALVAEFSMACCAEPQSLPAHCNV